MKDAIDERIYISNLFEIYGSLLNDRQKEIVEMYFLSDYSLAEIGEKYNISRQGAHESIKKSAAKLKEYEKKMSVLSSNEKREDIILSLREKIENIELDEKDRNELLGKIKELEEVS